MEAAQKVLKRETYFNATEGLLHNWGEVCYTGNPADIVKMIKAMEGNFFNTDQGMLAIRYLDQQVIYDDAFKSKKAAKEYYGEDYLPENIDVWFNFKKTSKDILVMTNLGSQGDGTELFDNLIKPCN